jgi:hypothetical protein
MTGILNKIVKHLFGQHWIGQKRPWPSLPFTQAHSHFLFFSAQDLRPLQLRLRCPSSILAWWSSTSPSSIASFIDHSDESSDNSLQTSTPPCRALRRPPPVDPAAISTRQSSCAPLPAPATSTGPAARCHPLHCGHLFVRFVVPGGEGAGFGRGKACDWSGILWVKNFAPSILVVFVYIAWFTNFGTVQLELYDAFVVKIASVQFNVHACYPYDWTKHFCLLSRTL